MTILQADKKIAATKKAIFSAERKGLFTSDLYSNLEVYQEIRNHADKIEGALKLIK